MDVKIVLPIKDVFVIGCCRLIAAIDCVGVVNYTYGAHVHQRNESIHLTKDSFAAALDNKLEQF